MEKRGYRKARMASGGRVENYKTWGDYERAEEKRGKDPKEREAIRRRMNDAQFKSDIGNERAFRRSRLPKGLDIPGKDKGNFDFHEYTDAASEASMTRNEDNEGAGPTKAAAAEKAKKKKKK